MKGKVARISLLLQAVALQSSREANAEDSKSKPSAHHQKKLPVGQEQGGRNVLASG